MNHFVCLIRATQRSRDQPQLIYVRFLFDLTGRTIYNSRVFKGALGSLKACDVICSQSFQMPITINTLSAEGPYGSNFPSVDIDAFVYCICIYWIFMFTVCTVYFQRFNVAFPGQIPDSLEQLSTDILQNCKEIHVLWE